MGYSRGWQRVKAYMNEVSPVEAYQGFVIVVDASSWIVSISKAAKAPLRLTISKKIEILRLSGARGVVLVLDYNEKNKRAEVLREILNDFGVGYMVSAPASAPAEKVCADLARGFQAQGYKARAKDLISVTLR